MPTIQSGMEPTVGIITAMAVEYVAVKALLENPMEYTAPGKGAGRRYLLGEAPAKNNDTHKIVLSLADAGNKNASRLSTILLKEFPSIKVIIVVGIAAGMPDLDKTDKQVHLGDVVVSGERGIVRCDSAVGARNEFVLKMPTRPPSPVLLEAANFLKINESEGERPWLKYIDQACKKLGATRPDFPRPRPYGRQPEIFIGSIASMSTVVHDPFTLAQLRDELGLKALEMEGSVIGDAVWDHEVGYLVIRGISDYGGSKAATDNWREYAAIAAAGYAWALLESTPTPILDIEHGVTRLIEKPSEEIKQYEDAAELPYCLKQLKVVDYKSIKEILVERMPVDARFIFLTGENGSGKSSILQAIAIGLYGNEDRKHGKIFCNRENSKIAVEVKIKNGRPLINNFLGKNNRYSTMRPFEYLAAYGPSRLEPEGERMSEEELKTSPVYSLFETNATFHNIQNWLKKLYLAGVNPELRGEMRVREKERMNRVIDLLVALMPHVTDIRWKTEGSDLVLYFEENGFEAPFRHLASGHKNILVMIGDLLIRLFRSQPHITDPGALSGIVLIDEFETHLHPKWQKEFPELLADIFPNVQFIVSTHSVITFLGAPKGSVFLNVTRSDADGTRVERRDIDVRNLLPNQILTSPIFGMENIKSVQNNRFESIRTEDTFQEVLKRDEVRERLKKYSKKFTLPESFPKAR